MSTQKQQKKETSIPAEIILLLYSLLQYVKRLLEVNADNNIKPKTTITYLLSLPKDNHTTIKLTIVWFIL